MKEKHFKKRAALKAVDVHIPDNSPQEKNLLIPGPSPMAADFLIPDPSPKGEGGRYIVTVEHHIPKKLLENARELRKNQTKAEAFLWQLLRNRQLNHLKFRRQHPLKAGFILDFFCAELKLGIEIDGGYHNENEQQEYDAERTKIINDYGIRIIRFTNEELLQNIENVLGKIVSAPLSSMERGRG